MEVETRGVNWRDLPKVSETEKHGGRYGKKPLPTDRTPIGRKVKD